MTNLKNRCFGRQRKVDALDYLEARLRELCRENQNRHEFVHCIACRTFISTQSEGGEIRWVQ